MTAQRRRQTTTSATPADDVIGSAKRIVRLAELNAVTQSSQQALNDSDPIPSPVAGRTCLYFFTAAIAFTAVEPPPACGDGWRDNNPAQGSRYNEDHATGWRQAKLDRLTSPEATIGAYPQRLVIINSATESGLCDCAADSARSADLGGLSISPGPPADATILDGAEIRDVTPPGIPGR